MLLSNTTFHTQYDSQYGFRSNRWHCLAPIPSTLAATLRANQLAKIQAAKARRKRDTQEPSEDQGPEPTPAQAAAPITPVIAANKASRSGNDSPGGSSPQPTNNTAPAPVPETPDTANKGNRSNGGRKKK